MPPPLSDRDKSNRPPRLDRKEEVVLKYASSKPGKKSGSASKKTAQSDNEMIMVWKDGGVASCEHTVTYTHTHRNRLSLISSNPWMLKRLRKLPEHSV